MALPLSLTNVPYRVAGSSLYKGDLIITDELIYYFPHTEAAAKIYSIISDISFLFMGSVGTIGVKLFAPTLLKGLAKDVIKENLVKPHTYRGKLELEGDAEWQAWSDNFDRSLPKPDVNLSYLYPAILYPALWYPLILDSLITTLNEENQSLSNYSIPEPVRFSRGAVKGIKLTALGTLLIETEFDMKHKFRISLFKKGKLHQALMESHYITQS